MLTFIKAEWIKTLNRFLKLNRLLGFGIFLFVIQFLISCKEKTKIEPTSTSQKGKGFFVVNEGTFTMGNASIYFINLENDSLNTNEDLFKPSNNRPLGDVFQSMSYINEQAWLVVNNSGKIEVIDPSTCKSVAVIKGLKSPRFACEVSPGKVYVTDLYSNTIHIIDSKNYVNSGEIKCKGWTEDLLVYKNKVWVCNHNSQFIYLIDPSTDLLTDSIEVAYGGSNLFIGKEGNIWVLCSGDNLKNKTGGIFSIDANNLKINKKWLFDNSNFNPIKLKENLGGDSLYFITNGIYKYSKNENIIPSSPFISQSSSSNFYGLTIHPKSGNLFVADARDFVSRGRILQYSSNGDFIKDYKAGGVPSEFMFW